jgi:hypothetical protein
MASGTVQLERFDPGSDCERLRACHAIAMPENRGIAFCALTVSLDQRRAGAGTALLTRCAIGAVAGHADVLRTLTITPRTPARLAALRPAAEQAATGYELLSWHGLPPEQHLSQLAVVLMWELAVPPE